MEKGSDPDFIAIAIIMGGSVFGRAKDRESAIRRCKAEARDFGKALGGWKKGAVCKANLFDLSDTGINQVTWDDFGVKGDGKPLPVKPEIVDMVMA